MKIGDQIRDARKRQDMTQKQLAEKSGVSEISIRSYENHKREPKISQIEKIAKALNISLGELIGWSDTVAAREQSGVSVGDIAYELNLPENMLKAFEEGRETPPPDFVEKYAFVTKILDNESKMQEFSRNQRQIVNIFERLSPQSQKKIIELALLYSAHEGETPDDEYP